MAAHPVEYEHKRSLVGYDDGSTILVVLSISERGDLGIFDLHKRLIGYPPRLRLRMSPLCYTESAETDIGTLTWEIRAVNHRYLDIQFKLPEELRPNEQKLRQRASAALGRGKIECSLFFRRAFNQDSELRVDTEIVELIGHRISDLTAKLPNVAAVNPIDILRWPGVVQPVELDVEPLFDAAAELLDKTLAAIAGMRASEGARIAEMLETRCDEIALIATKLDVDEELDRLESHLVEIRDAIAADKPVGRRLDFLMQELNREANTLGSKSADAETTRAAVDLKVLIEQMREQIQNVE